MARWRDYAFLLVVVIAVVLAGWVLILPDTLPQQLQPLFEVVEEQSTPGKIAGAIALLVLGIATFQWGIRSPQDTDRSLITDKSPEAVHESPLPAASRDIETLYATSKANFTDPTVTERRIAMYGHRARHSLDLPEEIETLFDELRITARDTIATATGCDPADADEAIRSGTWTDNRKAAAFLASDVEPAAEFTILERLFAWLSPEDVFEQRVRETLEAIEQSATGYLTYDAPTAERVVSRNSTMEDTQ